MPHQKQFRDFARLFELIRQGNLADQFASAGRHDRAIDSDVAAAFLASATRSLVRGHAVR